MRTSVLRRYTPPTCTLEIAATGSPLSRWTDRPVLKQVRFQLSFDDPRLASDDPVTVRGDRTELEALCDAVSTYVQNLLDLPQSALVSLPSPQPPLGSPLTSSGVPYSREGDRHASATSAGIATASRAIHLKPKSLVSHDLHLGSLATEESGATVSLSTLQLFDLANALEEYRADALALPSLGRPQWLNTSPAWAKAAAAVILAVGVTTSVVKFASAPPSSETASTQNQEEVIEDLAAAPRADMAPETSSAPASPLPPALFPTPAPSPGTGQSSADPGQLFQPTPGQPYRPLDGTRSVTEPARRPANPNARPSGEIAPLPSLAPVSPQVATIPRQNESSTASTELQIQPQSGIASAPAAQQAAPETMAAPPASRNRPLAPPLESTDLPQEQPAAPSQDMMFDVIPQVPEARGYLEQRWTPPEGLTQTLEYRVVLNSDGTVKQVTPLGSASRLNQAQTPIPLPGEPFVSPVASGQETVLRIVLYRDGKVQTFLETNP